MRPRDIYAKAGYEVISLNMAIVWDRAKFWRHVGRADSDLRDWALTFDPPITYFNGYLWVYSPGPQPNSALYLR